MIENETGNIERRKHSRDMSGNFIRALTCFLLCTLFTAISVFSLMNSLKPERTEIKYSEKSNDDYKVYLEKNEFFDEKYIGKGKQYIANLIDNIDISMSHNFTSDKNLNYKYSYKIDGKLVIFDKENEKNELYSKNYELAKNTSKEEKNSNGFFIKKDVLIDYSEYNELANDFKSTYKITGDSKLIVTLTVDVVAQYEDMPEPLTKTASSSITIPLTETTISIGMDSNSINSEDTFVYEDKNVNLVFLTIGILSSLMSIILLVKSIQIGTRKMRSMSKYEKFIKKIKNEYGALIIETKTRIDESKYKEVFELNDFYEVLDKAKLAQTNILYFEDKEKCTTWFSVIEGDRLYRRIYSGDCSSFK